MVFQLGLIEGDARKLTQSMVQIIMQLDMVNAEPASVLHIHCINVRRLVNARCLLAPKTAQWRQVDLFVEFYRLLFEFKSGNGIGMRHWLRGENDAPGAALYKLIVDGNQLAHVIQMLLQYTEPERTLDISK